MVLWWLLLGCGETECKEGFSKANDGLCYPDDDEADEGDGFNLFGDDDDDHTGRRFDSRQGFPGHTGRRSVLPPGMPEMPGVWLTPQGPELMVASRFDASWARVDALHARDGGWLHEAVDLMPTAFSARGPSYTELHGSRDPSLPWSTVAAWVVRVYDVDGELVHCEAHGPEREALLFDASFVVAAEDELVHCEAR